MRDLVIVVVAANFLRHLLEAGDCALRCLLAAVILGIAIVSFSASKCDAVVHVRGCRNVVQRGRILRQMQIGNFLA